MALVTILGTFLLLRSRQPNAHRIRMRPQSLAVRQGRNDGAKTLQTLRRNLLRREVLLERLRVHAAELPRVAVRRERVVRARGVVATAVRGVLAYPPYT